MCVSDCVFALSWCVVGLYACSKERRSVPEVHSQKQCEHSRGCRPHQRTWAAGQRWALLGNQWDGGPSICSVSIKPATQSFISLGCNSFGKLLNVLAFRGSQFCFFNFSMLENACVKFSGLLWGGSNLSETVTSMLIKPIYRAQELYLDTWTKRSSDREHDQI